MVQLLVRMFSSRLQTTIALQVLQPFTRLSLARFIVLFVLRRSHLEKIQADTI